MELPIHRPSIGGNINLEKNSSRQYILLKFKKIAFRSDMRKHSPLSKCFVDVPSHNVGPEESSQCCEMDYHCDNIADHQPLNTFSLTNHKHNLQKFWVVKSCWSIYSLYFCNQKCLQLVDIYSGFNKLELSVCY